MTSLSGGRRFFKVRFRMACLLAVAASANVAFAAPTARIVASRTSGPAPLAVFFDATTTTDSSPSVDAFRQIGYRFTFDDASAGTWQHSGLPKNEQIGGPLAAHVFDTPGTYTVRVQARDASGGSSEAAVTINVVSADAAFSGNNTVCISKSSDFNGCPAGAQQISSAISWPAFQSGKRYLLRAGHDFTSLGEVSLGQFLTSGIADFQLSSFGAGAKPRLGNISFNGSQNPTSSNRGKPERATVMNLDTPSIGSWYSSSDLLFYRNSLTRGGSIGLSGIFVYELQRSGSNGWQVPSNNFAVENDIGLTDAGGDGITGLGTRLVILGNNVDRTNQHNVRLWQGHKVFVAHNRLPGHSTDVIRHGFKMHSAGTGANVSDLSAPQVFSQRSSEVVLANNSFGASNNNQNWLAAIGPQNNEALEAIEKVVAEDNRFVRGSNHYLDLYFVGRNVTERGNFNVTTNATTTFVATGNESAMPSEWVGPYYLGQPSMRLRFSDAYKIPKSPVLSIP